MSASAAQKWVPTAATLPAGSMRTRVEVLPGRRVAVRRKTWPYVLLAVVLVLLTMVAPLMVNTQMAQRSYEIRDQQIALSELNATIESLEADLRVASTSARLEEKARESGLVRAGEAGTISLGSSQVEGGVRAE